MISQRINQGEQFWCAGILYGDVPLQNIDVSIWPGPFPESDARERRDSVEEMVHMYAARGFPARRHSEEPA
jgi:hypothetical protein